VAPDEVYSIEWVRPSGTVGFYPIKIPHLTLQIASTVSANVSISFTTTPVVDNLALASSDNCAQPKSPGGFEGGGPLDVLTLNSQPCTTDLSVTNTMNYDDAFIDPTSGDVIGRGHVGIVALSSAWQAVSVVP
jgi:hypothetical protein